MPQFNPNKKPSKIYSGHDENGNRTETLDKVVHDMIQAEEKTMNDFTSEYPYNKMVRNDAEYQTDEEAENAETQQEDLKAHLQQANQRIDNLIDVLRSAEDQIKAPINKREMVKNPDDPLGMQRKKTITSYFDEKYLEPTDNTPMYMDPNQNMEQESLPKTKSARK